MDIKLCYFAWVREQTGIDQEQIELPDSVKTVADLIAWLKSRGPEFQMAFERAEVIRAAVDQTHVPHETQIRGASEIAFFPPVTGG
jgi:molybdopterin synthase sulfur carrier subunit